MVFHYLSKRRAAMGLELASPLPGAALGLELASPLPGHALGLESPLLGLALGLE